MNRHKSTAVHHGLEGVIVAETELSRVDGQMGELVVRGHRIAELSGEIAFAELCELMWWGEVGGNTEQSVEQLLAEGRVAAFEAMERWRYCTELDSAMSALVAVIARTRSDDRDAPETSATQDGNAVSLDSNDPRWLGAAGRILGAIPVATAAWQRRRSGLPAIPPNPTLSHGADYLQMLGLESRSGDAAALDAYWAAVVDHGLNASTFTARVVASTGSDLVSSIAAAIGALKGPLHGGAPGPVLDMLDAIGAPENAEPWLVDHLEHGRRIMGMGHRIYRVRDPRAAVLETALNRLIASRGQRGRLALARSVEKTAERLLSARFPSRPLRANVEFYTAVLLEAIGIPRALFSATFAASRAVGWIAHVLEQRRRGRLIRPKSVYVGVTP